jgi:hypothetical protein
MKKAGPVARSRPIRASRAVPRSRIPAASAAGPRRFDHAMPLGISKPRSASIRRARRRDAYAGVGPGRYPYRRTDGTRTSLPRSATYPAGPADGA